MTSIDDTIEQYVQENFLYARPDYVLESDTKLLKEGLVDSMGVMELVDFIEEKFGLTVQDADITEQNFESTGSIARFIRSRLEPSPY